MASKKAKAEKKRLKAQAKIAKARAKYSVPEPVQKKWYKNPDWIRAIAAVIAIILTVIGLFYFR